MLYRLQSFGIPVDLLPLGADCELKVGNHVKWMDLRKAKESTRTEEERAIQFAPSPRLQTTLPGRNDVLLGKGKPIQNHPGNVAMRSLVNSHMPEYSLTPKHIKGTYAARA